MAEELSVEERVGAMIVGEDAPQEEIVEEVAEEVAEEVVAETTEENNAEGVFFRSTIRAYLPWCKGLFCEGGL